jgi:UDP-glucuronate 4-epimerase
MYGDGSTSRDYTYIEDTLQGIIAATKYNETTFEIINLGNNYSVSLKQLISSIENVVGKKATIEQLPEQPGDVPRTFADISKAKRLLGYEPKTGISEGLEIFYNWFVHHKEILLRQ